MTIEIVKTKMSRETEHKFAATCLCLIPVFLLLAVLVAIHKHGNREINTRGYKEVSTMLKKFPELKPEIDLIKEDGITINEIESLRNKYYKMLKAEAKGELD